MILDQHKRNLLSLEFPFLGWKGEYQCQACGALFHDRNVSDGAFVGQLTTYCPECDRVRDVSEVLASSKYYFLGADTLAIRKADSKVIESVGHEDTWSYCDGSRYDGTIYYVVDSDHDVTEVPCNGYYGRAAQHDLDDHATGQSVAEFCYQHGITPHYIVEEQRYNCSFDDLEDEHNIVLYKVKDSVCTDTIRKGLKKAYLELDKELAQVE